MSDQKQWQRSGPSLEELFARGLLEPEHYAAMVRVRDGREPDSITPQTPHEIQPELSFSEPTFAEKLQNTLLRAGVGAAMPPLKALAMALDPAMPAAELFGGIPLNIGLEQARMSEEARQRLRERGPEIRPQPTFFENTANYARSMARPLLAGAKQGARAVLTGAAEGIQRTPQWAWNIASGNVLRTFNDSQTPLDAAMNQVPELIARPPYDPEKSSVDIFVRDLLDKATGKDVGYATYSEAERLTGMEPLTYGIMTGVSDPGLLVGGGPVVKNAVRSVGNIAKAVAQKSGAADNIVAASSRLSDLLSDPAAPRVSNLLRHSPAAKDLGLTAREVVGAITNTKAWKDSADLLPATRNANALGEAASRGIVTKRQAELLREIYGDIPLDQRTMVASESMKAGELSKEDRQRRNWNAAVGRMFETPVEKADALAAGDAAVRLFKTSKEADAALASMPDAEQFQLAHYRKVKSLGGKGVWAVIHPDRLKQDFARPEWAAVTGGPSVDPKKAVGQLLKQPELPSLFTSGAGDVLAPKSFNVKVKKVDAAGRALGKEEFIDELTRTVTESEVMATARSMQGKHAKTLPDGSTQQIVVEPTEPKGSRDIAILAEALRSTAGNAKGVKRTARDIATIATRGAGEGLTSPTMERLVAKMARRAADGQPGTTFADKVEEIRTILEVGTKRKVVFRIRGLKDAQGLPIVFATPEKAHAYAEANNLFEGVVEARLPWQPSLMPLPDVDGYAVFGAVENAPPKPVVVDPVAAGEETALATLRAARDHYVTGEIAVAPPKSAPPPQAPPTPEAPPPPEASKAAPPPAAPQGPIRAPSIYELAPKLGWDELPKHKQDWILERDRARNGFTKAQGEVSAAKAKADASIGTPDHEAAVAEQLAADERLSVALAYYKRLGMDKDPHFVDMVLPEGFRAQVMAGAVPPEEISAALAKLDEAGVSDKNPAKVALRRQMEQPTAQAAAPTPDAPAQQGLLPAAPTEAIEDILRAAEEPPPRTFSPDELETTRPNPPEVAARNIDEAIRNAHPTGASLDDTVERRLAAAERALAEAEGVVDARIPASPSDNLSTLDFTGPTWMLTAKRYIMANISGLLGEIAPIEGSKAANKALSLVVEGDKIGHEFGLLGESLGKILPSEVDRINAMYLMRGDLDSLKSGAPQWLKAYDAGQMPAVDKYIAEYSDAVRRMMTRLKLPGAQSNQSLAEILPNFTDRNRYDKWMASSAADLRKQESEVSRLLSKATSKEDIRNLKIRRKALVEARERLEAAPYVMRQSDISTLVPEDELLRIMRDPGQARMMAGAHEHVSGLHMLDPQEVYVAALRAGLRHKLATDIYPEFKALLNVSRGSKSHQQEVTKTFNNLINGTTSVEHAIANTLNRKGHRLAGAAVETIASGLRLTRVLNTFRLLTGNLAGAVRNAGQKMAFVQTYGVSGVAEGLARLAGGMNAKAAGKTDLMMEALEASGQMGSGLSAQRMTSRDLHEIVEVGTRAKNALAGAGKALKKGGDLWMDIELAPFSFTELGVRTSGFATTWVHAEKVLEAVRKTGKVPDELRDGAVVISRYHAKRQLARTQDVFNRLPADSNLRKAISDISDEFARSARGNLHEDDIVDVAAEVKAAIAAGPAAEAKWLKEAASRGVTQHNYVMTGVDRMGLALSSETMATITQFTDFAVKDLTRRLRDTTVKGKAVLFGTLLAIGGPRSMFIVQRLPEDLQNEFQSWYDNQLGAPSLTSETGVDLTSMLQVGVPFSKEPPKTAGESVSRMLGPAQGLVAPTLDAVRDSSKATQSTGFAELTPDQQFARRLAAQHGMGPNERRQPSRVLVQGDTEIPGLLSWLGPGTTYGSVAQTVNPLVKPLAESNSAFAQSLASLVAMPEAGTGQYSVPAYGVGPTALLPGVSPRRRGQRAAQEDRFTDTLGSPHGVGFDQTPRSAVKQPEGLVGNIMRELSFPAERNYAESIMLTDDRKRVMADDAISRGAGIGGGAILAQPAKLLDDPTMPEDLSIEYTKKYGMEISPKVIANARKKMLLPMANSILERYSSKELVAASQASSIAIRLADISGSVPMASPEVQHEMQESSKYLMLKLHKAILDKAIADSPDGALDAAVGALAAELSDAGHPQFDKYLGDLRREDGTFERNESIHEMRTILSDTTVPREQRLEELQTWAKGADRRWARNPKNKGTPHATMADWFYRTTLESQPR